MINVIKLELNFHPKEIYFPCTDTFQLIKNNHKIYYSIDNTYIYNNKNYHSISYHIYYLYNGAIGFGYQFFPQKKNLGFHEYDIERIKILFDPETLIPKYVFFSAHRNEGKWIKWNDCEKNNNGDLKIYISRVSHANYHKSGTWNRIFFLANDKCSKKGRKMVPSLIKSNFNFNPPEFEENSPFMKRIMITE